MTNRKTDVKEELGRIREEPGRIAVCGHRPVGPRIFVITTPEEPVTSLAHPLACDLANPFIENEESRGSLVVINLFHPAQGGAVSVAAAVEALDAEVRRHGGPFVVAGFSHACAVVYRWSISYQLSVKNGKPLPQRVGTALLDPPGRSLSRWERRTRRIAGLARSLPGPTGLPFRLWVGCRWREEGFEPHRRWQEDEFEPHGRRQVPAQAAAYVNLLRSLGRRFHQGGIEGRVLVTLHNGGTTRSSAAAAKRYYQQEPWPKPEGWQPRQIVEIDGPRIPLGQAGVALARELYEFSVSAWKEWLRS